MDGDGEREREREYTYLVIIFKLKAVINIWGEFEFPDMMTL